MQTIDIRGMTAWHLSLKLAVAIGQAQQPIACHEAHMKTALRVTDSFEPARNWQVEGARAGEVAPFTNQVLRTSPDPAYYGILTRTHVLILSTSPSSTCARISHLKAFRTFPYSTPAFSSSSSPPHLDHLSHSAPLFLRRSYTLKLTISQLTDCRWIIAPAT
jgi:hypothetical protein